MQMDINRGYLYQSDNFPIRKERAMKYFNKLVCWLSTQTAEKLIAMSILIILWDIVFFFAKQAIRIAIQ